MEEIQGISGQMTVQPRPYAEDDVPPFEEWTTAPVEVHVTDLIPTQPVLVIDRLHDLMCGAAPHGLDPYPHIVNAGDLYIHDGHHRWAIAWLQGRSKIEVRMSKIRKTSDY